MKINNLKKRNEIMIKEHLMFSRLIFYQFRIFRL
jgi:hypothetical protein